MVVDGVKLLDVAGPSEVFSEANRIGARRRGRAARRPPRHHALASHRPAEQSYSDIVVEPDAMFVRDGTTFTSAGVSAGIDLALALLEDDHGEELARQVAHRSWCSSDAPAGSRSSPPR